MLHSIDNTNWLAPLLNKGISSLSLSRYHGNPSLTLLITFGSTKLGVVDNIMAMDQLSLGIYVDQQTYLMTHGGSSSILLERKNPARNERATFHKSTSLLIGTVGVIHRQRRKCHCMSWWTSRGAKRPNVQSQPCAVLITVICALLFSEIGALSSSSGWDDRHGSAA